MTDDSGGRTEIVRDPRDLDPGDGEHRRRIEPAVLPGYPAAGKKDGRWHSIRVELRNGALPRPRDRRGYLAI